MQWVVDDIAEVLAVTDVHRILHDYFHEGRGRDPIVHFYETFLTEYDPGTREKRGVYYTPEPVVSYIVRSVHRLLKEDFQRPDGLADPGVTLLDPAAGTLTFPAEAAQVALKEFTSRYGEGGKENFLRQHILKNLYAFELMMAPYAIGHLKISFLLEEMGYRMADDERFRFYLTNTLEMDELEQTSLPGMSSLSEESHEAGRIKKAQPILVVMGNPPYSVSSANRSGFIEKEMEVYKKDVKAERNIQPLSDDYIKFLRFAQWKVEQTGTGVVGMITNNSYLSGLIHRGMRRHLLETFNEIYILNLHGSSRIGEQTPEGDRDENVFDIQQGVCIGIFVKTRNQKSNEKVFYYDLYGMRKDKYEFLKTHDLTTTRWKTLRPTMPYYFFVPKDFSHDEYQGFWSVKDIFRESSSGVKTHRDHFLVGFTKEEVKQRMMVFTGNLPDEVVRKGLRLRDTRDWKFTAARQCLQSMDWQKHIIPYSYRAFDTRYICYIPALIDRGCDRWSMMRQFFKENIGLVTTRLLNREAKSFHHAFVNTNVIDIGFLSSKTSETSYIFPLYLYSFKNGTEEDPVGDRPSRKRQGHQDIQQLMLQEPTATYGQDRRPNLSEVFLNYIRTLYKRPPSAEEIFYYIYGVLYSNIYRKRYAEFLKIDFPRVPFTEDRRLFNRLSQLGQRLVNLHLMEEGSLPEPVVRFQGRGTGKVEKLQYIADRGILYINRDQFFEGIKEEVYRYQIGGYQVLDKYLKDRKTRTLSLEEIR
ncbi:MAG: DNA methyltransferase, partial [Nitrospirae bacterium]